MISKAWVIVLLVLLSNSFNGNEVMGYVVKAYLSTNLDSIKQSEEPQLTNAIKETGDYRQS